MAISIREHCIPASDFLSRLRNVAPIPSELDSMEQKTGGGIIKKIKAVVESPYFKALPKSATIRSGANPAYEWRKADAAAEAEQIWNECKDDL